ncbi:MAG: FIST N-terminal domain-containing protein [Formivibrio sp.]|nr:FIST N-terminal domain-containing protein [Formivibrio sp.]
MEISQFCWTPNTGWETPPASARTANLVLVFAQAAYFRQPKCYQDLRRMFPTANILGCSTAGSIYGTTISDGDIIVTAVNFKKGHVRLVRAETGASGDLQTIAAALMTELAAADLRHAFVLSDGLSINGSDLARGLNSTGIPVTGGLAGDGTSFASTWVMANAPAAQNLVALIGFFGEIKVKSGCIAGWGEFGAERLITRSHGNVMYEIDHQPALTIYTKYLGQMAKDLPSSGLRFPLSIRTSEQEEPVIRTLLGIDPIAHSLTFAGDVPQGGLCRLMKTDVDTLIESSGTAADAAKPDTKDNPSLGIVVSCVGRRLVLGQLTEEELDIVRDRLGPKTTLSGFYSYGELAPFSNTVSCQLHNQTMTLTTLTE